MEDVVTSAFASALPALCGLVSFWLAWLLQSRRDAQMRLAARMPLRAAFDGEPALAAQAILVGAIRARVRRRPVERWLARVQRRLPAPSDAVSILTSRLDAAFVCHFKPAVAH